jgi:hypothetical protein
MRGREVYAVNQLALIHFICAVCIGASSGKVSIVGAGSVITDLNGRSGPLFVHIFCSSLINSSLTNGVPVQKGENPKKASADSEARSSLRGGVI